MPTLTPELLALLRSVYVGDVWHCTDEWTGHVSDKRVDSWWGVAPEMTDVTGRMAVLRNAGWAETDEDNEKWRLTEAGSAVYEKAQAALAAASS